MTKNKRTSRLPLNFGGLSTYARHMSGEPQTDQGYSARQQKNLQDARDFYAGQFNLRQPEEEKPQEEPVKRATTSPGIDRGAVGATQPVSRDGTGFSVQKSPLDSWKDYQGLKEAATKVIDMQQKRGEDLREPKAYWDELRRDTTSFGAERAPEATTVGVFDDPAFRELSPADQASIRLSRRGAADAHIGAIEDERQYRERVAGTALDNIRDIYGMMQDDVRTEQEQANLDREFRLGLLDAGIGGIQEVDADGNLRPVSPEGIVTHGGDVFNFKGYAEDEDWGKRVQRHLSRVPTFEDYGGYGTTDRGTTRHPTSFDAYLAREHPNSGLIGHGRTIARQAQEKGIPPEVLMAVINHESSHGTSPVFKNNNNPGGVTWFKGVFPDEWRGTSRPAEEGRVYVKFPTIADGISSTATSLRNRNRENYANMVFPGGGDDFDSIYTDSRLADLAIRSGVPISQLQRMSDDEKQVLDIEHQEPDYNTAVTKAIDSLYDGLHTTYDVSREVIEDIVVQMTSVPLEDRERVYNNIVEANREAGNAVHPNVLNEIRKLTVPDVAADARDAYSPEL